MIAFLDHFLFQLTSFLFLPIFLALFAMVCWTTISLGIFLREWIDHKRKGSQRLRVFRQEHDESIAEILRNPKYADIRLTEMVRRWEKKLNNRLDNIRFMIKAGPSIGLVGTLIPMGHALASLSSGDMTAMSENMVTAFTSTIVGITCGTIAYLIALGKEKWLHADFLACEVYVETRLREIAPSDKWNVPVEKEAIAVEEENMVR
ncbi:MotA/TolQ/ExbB proton channel family protein [Parapedobacter tibetensis]|uniref:MotA/TolQ/ExbB proton channel family protein n=1 Tax=Parapedobacter tibetensis TaxID=2972951 RepID=UPI00214D3D0D|nr:MotA/TolQ/ExbB proton channel family protein [Parapedobacter tibetensis]